jgi:hypothetical protein
MSLTRELEEEEEEDEERGSRLEEMGDSEDRFNSL